MAISPARKLAFEILLKVALGRGSTDDRLLSDEGFALKEPDRRLATEIVQGTLRLRGDLDYLLCEKSGKQCSSFDPEVLTALRLGAYQIRWLSRIPKPAAVNDSVELTKSAGKRFAAGLVNAVLRKCQPSSCRPGCPTWKMENPEALGPALRSLPDWLLSRWKRNFGDSGASALAWAAIERPPVTLRVLGGPAEFESAVKEIGEADASARHGRFAPHAVVVEPASHISCLRLIREGRALIQDEASQAVACLVSAEPGMRILDLCAAPGIKTSQIAQEMSRGFVAACDRSARRLKAMKKLLPRWMPPGISTRLVQLDALEELPFRGEFDRILVDAPCSGTGTLARNPEIKWRLNSADLGRYSSRQRHMLRQALPLLAPGGRLVYATCSLEPEENEEVVDAVLKDFPGFSVVERRVIVRQFPRLDPLIGRSGYFYSRPDLHRMDGFFAAVITRGS